MYFEKILWSTCSKLYKLIIPRPTKVTKKVKKYIYIINSNIHCLHVKDKNMGTNAVIKYIKGEISMKHRYREYAMADKFSNMVTQQYYALDRNDI